MVVDLFHNFCIDGRAFDSTFIFFMKLLSGFICYKNMLQHEKKINPSLKSTSIYHRCTQCTLAKM